MKRVWVMAERYIPLEGIHNFRSFGGYETSDGQKVGEGLFRSGQFSRASQADRQVLDGLNIRTVADLRRPREREREPSFWPDLQGVTVLASDHAGHAEPPHLAFLRESDLTFDSISGFMTDTYRRLPFDEGNASVFRDGIKALANKGASDGFVVHCAAGKDRTGIFCALVLLELGVDEETVRTDYMMTNEVVDFDAILPVFIKRIRDELGRDVGEDELRAFMGVDGSYLDAAMEKIGDRRRYFTETLGLDDDTLQKLSDRWRVRETD